METSERETIILLNRADMAEGFFNIGTSEKSEFSRLCRRIGGLEELIDLRIDKDRNGRIRWYQCKVPIGYLSPKTFAIGKRVKRKLSAERLEQLRKGLKRLSIAKETR